MKVDLVRIQDTLTVAEEAKRKAEAEAARLEVERMSLLLEIGVTASSILYAEIIPKRRN